MAALRQWDDWNFDLSNLNFCHDALQLLSYDVAGNLKEESSFLGGRKAQRPKAPPRMRFNPDFKFGAVRGDATSFRMSVCVPELSVRSF